MDTDTQKNNMSENAGAQESAAAVSVPVQVAPVVSGTPGEKARAFPPRNTMGGMGDRRKNMRKSPRREGRVKPEFDQKIIDIRRVARVVSGGRRFSFSVALVAGNRKGSVGVGAGKAGDTALAIDKALRDAKKHMIKVNVTKTMSIPHEVSAKFSSARVFMMPAAERGVIAGSSVRTVLELAGLKDIVAKLFSGTKNRVNNAQAAIKALSQLSLPRAYHLAEKVVSEGEKKTEKVEKATAKA